MRPATAPVLVIEYIALAPPVRAVPALVIENVAPTPVTEYVTPARTMESTDSANHHVSLTAVQASAPQVIP